MALLGPNFRFYLRKDASNYYHVNAAGNVVLSAARIPLQNDPDGWEQTDAANVRNKKYDGLERQYANPYRFVKDGAKILRFIDYTQGPAATCQIEIEQRNALDGLYTPYSIGDIDFSAETEDGPDFYSAPIKELGLAGILRAKMDVDIEIPIDGPQAVTASISSFELNGAAKWLTAYPTPFVAATPLVVVYYVFNAQDTIGYPITPNNSTYGLSSSSGQPGWIFMANQPLTNVRLKGTVHFTLQSNGGNVSYDVLLRTSANGTPMTIASGAVPGGTTGTFSVDFSSVPAFNMAVGDIVQLLVGTNPGQTPNNPPFVLSWQTGEALDVSYRFYGPSFSLRGLRPAELFRRIVEKHTGGQYTGISNFLSDQTITYAQGLDNIPFRTLFTSGNAIRGIAGATIKTTLGRFLDTCNALWCTGYSVENGQARVERKSRYYDTSTVLASFDNPKSVVIRKASDYQYKKVTTGYSTQATEKVNGRDEYNALQVRETPNNRTQLELNLQSPALASMYTLFTTYSEYAYRTTADSPKDNDMFLLEIEGQPFGPVYRAQTWPNGAISGVAVGTGGLNYGLTPEKCFRRHGAFVRIGLYGQDSELIKFQLAEKNSELQTNLASGLIVAKADVPVSSLAPALALPYELVAVVNSPRNIINVTAGQQGGIEVFYRGKMRRGIPIKVGVKSATLGEYEITLLLATSNNLSELIQ